MRCMVAALAPTVVTTRDAVPRWPVTCSHFPGLRRSRIHGSVHMTWQRRRWQCCAQQASRVQRSGPVRGGRGGICLRCRRGHQRAQPDLQTVGACCWHVWGREQCGRGRRASRCAGHATLLRTQHQQSALKLVVTWDARGHRPSYRMARKRSELIPVVGRADPTEHGRRSTRAPRDLTRSTASELLSMRSTQDSSRAE